MYYDLTVPLFTKALTNLKHFLEKGRVQAETLGVSETDFLQFRLADDMFPLIKQVQIATDNAKGATARLAGVEPKKIEDVETTCAELIARIDTVLAHLQTFTPEQFAGAAERQVTLPYFENQYFLGHDYLLDFALPNFYFHLNMAYAIIRAEGTSLGKQDYIGNLTMHPVATS